MKIILLIILLAITSPVLGQSLDPADWDIRFSHGMPTQPRSLPDPNDGAWYFKFPTIGSVHYLTTPWRGNLNTYMITMKVKIKEISGDPRYIYLGPKNQCLVAANVRPYFDTGNMYSEFGRWWYRSSIPLMAGVFEIVVPLEQPDQWGSVYGKGGDQRPGAFKQAKKQVRNVGFTFGGGCAYGHGVRVVKGKAWFILKDFSLR